MFRYLFRPPRSVVLNTLVVTSKIDVEYLMFDCAKIEYLRLVERDSDIKVKQESEKRISLQILGLETGNQIFMGLYEEQSILSSSCWNPSSSPPLRSQPHTEIFTLQLYKQLSQDQTLQ